MNLCTRLQAMGYRVWYDNGQKADHRNLAGMKAGVRASECLLIFLSGRNETKGQPDPQGQYEGPFTRWFCHEEMATAHEAGLRCIGVMETDPRHGEPDFALEKERARTGGKAGGPVHSVHVEMNLRLLDEVCFIPLRRQEHELQAMLDEIVRQSRVAKRLVVEGVPPIQAAHDAEPKPEPEPEPEPEPKK